MEGAWEAGRILHGFHVNVETDEMRLPGANIDGASLTIHKPDFDHGNTVVLLKRMQELRGLVTHYNNCNHKWKISARPIDEILAYADVCSMWTRCDESSYWASFWNMIASIRRISQIDQTWKKLFTCTLVGLMPSRV